MARVMVSPAGVAVALQTVAGLVLAGTLSPLPAQTRAATPAPADTLIERTLAIVGGAVVTQSDVALAVALGLVDEAATATPATALSALVDRWLMLHEVARFAPAEPTAAAVEARLAVVEARLGDPAAVTRRLADAGRGPAHLAAWVRDDLRIAAYLEQRFASTGAPADADVARYAEMHAAGLAQEGLSGAEALTAARSRLAQERRSELIADWLADLRRRTSVVTFALPPG